MSRSIGPPHLLELARLALCIVAAAAASAMGAESGEATPPNVVLLSLDTLRADHLGCYGYERPTSPNLDAFARRATLYSRAVSSSSWTLPAHASMFTGKPVFEHQARNHRIGGRPRARPLDAEQLTLAEALEQRGYRTGAFVANDGYLLPYWNLSQGFSTYHLERIPAVDLNERIFTWLDGYEDAPFFLFINYMDTHRPYNTKPRPGLLETPAVQDDGELLVELIEKVLPAKDPLPRALARKVIDQYDTAIANLDEGVGALLDRLERDGRFEDTVILITSDHGEYFGEHHLVEHGKDVFQPVAWVPLLVRGPGQRQARVDETPIGSNDFPRLIASHLPDALEAELAPLFPDRPGNHPVLIESFFARAEHADHPVWGWRFQHVQRAIYDWPYKYVRSSDGNHALYQLLEDPGENRNLIDARAEIARQLAARLEAFTSRRASKSSSKWKELDEEDLRLLKERLRSLGYID